MIAITQAALHVTLRNILQQGTALADVELASSYYEDALGTLCTLVDPAHAPAVIPDPHPSAARMPMSRPAKPQGAGESTQDIPPKSEEGGEPLTVNSGSAPLPRWSAVRRDLLGSLVGGPLTWREIAERLEEHPGPSITYTQASAYWQHVLGPQRDPEMRKRVRKEMSDERDALLRQLWRDGIDEDEIAARMSALPGPALIGRNIRALAAAKRLGSRKPGKTRRTVSAEPQAHMIPPVAAPATAAPSTTKETAPAPAAGAVAVPAGRPPRPVTQSSTVPGAAARSLPVYRSDMRADMDERDKLEARVALKKGRSVESVAWEFGQPITVIQALAQDATA